MNRLSMLAENIGFIEAKQTYMGLEVGTRMTIVRVPPNQLILISPIAIEPAVAVEIQALGRVSAIVAPNLFHHLHIEECQSCFPEATLYVADGLPEKRIQAGNPLPPHIVLRDEAEELWRDSMDQLYFREFRILELTGAKPTNEVVFFHRPSGTLTLTDTAFHFTHNSSAGMQMIARLSGMHGRVGSLLQDRWVMKNRLQARAVLNRILDWPIQAIILTHGDIVTHDAKQKLRDGYAWLLNAS